MIKQQKSFQKHVTGKSYVNSTFCKNNLSLEPAPVTQCWINCFVMSEINSYDSRVYWLSHLVAVTLLYGTDILRAGNSKKSSRKSRNHPLKKAECLARQKNRYQVLQVLLWGWFFLVLTWLFLFLIITCFWKCCCAWGRNVLLLGRF